MVTEQHDSTPLPTVKVSRVVFEMNYNENGS